jgi:outer membrane protein assembly factor BamB
MRNYLSSYLSLFILLFVMNGCGGGGVNPVLPGVGNDQSADQTAMTNGHANPIFPQSGPANLDELPVISDAGNTDIGIMGGYNLTISSDGNSVELVPMRATSIGESWIVSGRSFFDTYPCKDCFRISGLGYETGKIIVKFNIRHPFPKGDTGQPATAQNRLDLDLFDLALVVAPKPLAPHFYPLLQVNIPDYSVENPDGFSTELTNLIGSQIALPYILIVDDSSTTPPSNTFNKFEMGSSRNFDVKFPVQPGEILVFDLYITFGYGASAVLANRLDPDYYNPEFNRKAAWKVEVTPPNGTNPPVEGNTWGDLDNSTAYNVTVKVYDWQIGANVDQNLTNPTDIYSASNVDYVSVEIPGMNNSAKQVDGDSYIPGGTGMPGSPLVYQVPIANENLLSTGEYVGLVEVHDQREPLDITQGRDFLVHSPDGKTFTPKNIPGFRTYQIFTASVVVELPVDPPPVPGNVIASDGEFCDHVLITWASATGATGYKVYRGNPTILLHTTDSTTLQWEDDTAEPGQHYPFWVVAYNSGGDSDASQPDDGWRNSVPETPQNLTASDGECGHITIAWEQVEETGVTYWLYRDGNCIKNDLDVTQYDDSPPTHFQNYNYYVKAHNICGESAQSNEDIGRFIIIPDTPQNVTATDGNTNNVKIMWVSSEGTDKYLIYRDSSYLGETSAIPPIPPPLEYFDLTAEPGRHYNYSVKAHNICGDSDMSDADEGWIFENPGQRGDWWMFGHDRQHTGRSQYVGSEGNNIEWTYPTGLGICTSPAIASDGTIYICSDKLYAINSNGTFKWSYTPSFPFIQSSPAIASDGTIYFGCDDGKLFAINSNGSYKWSYTTGDNIISSPVIGFDNTIYVGSDDDKLHAVKPDGTMKWTFNTGGDIACSPAIGFDGTIYFGSDDIKLYAVYPSGSIKWSYTIASMDSSPAVGSDGTIYVGSNSGFLCALNPNGTKKWEYRPSPTYSINSGPSIGSDGTIYVGCTDNKLYAIRPDGSFKWNYPTGNYIYSNPAVDANGNIYFTSWDGYIYSLASNGSFKWNYYIGGILDSSPSIGSDGTIYVGGDDKNLYAFCGSSPTRSIDVTSPDGGELWYVYSTHNITWSSQNITGNVKIELSINGGLSWPTTIISSTSNSGFYSWLVPDFPTPTARVKITSVDFPTVSDMSYNNFNISPVPGEWHIQTVDWLNNVGQRNSLACISNKPAISYIDYSNSELKYIRANDEHGASWGSSVTVDTYTAMSRIKDTRLKTVNGFPAILYGLDYDVKYTRALDVFGSGNWGSPVLVSDHSGINADLIIANAYPAAAYIGNPGLYFKRASDNLGGSWPVTEMELEGGAHFECSAEILNNSGNAPAIVYPGASNNEVMYIYSQNSSGSSWNSPKIIVNESNCAGMHLKVANGHPAVVYSHNSSLFYIRASDSSGIDWSSNPVNLTSGNTSTSMDFDIINGVPAVTYCKPYDYDHGELWFIISNDANGNSWNSGVKVDGGSAISAGYYNSLEDINGHPGISYTDGTIDDLKFAIYY